MSKLQKLLGSALLALTAVLTGLAAPGAAHAGDHCYYPPKPCYTPPCCPTYQPPCYHYVYHTEYVKVPYTCYDECGHPYTAYKVEAVQTKVKVAD